MTDTWGGYWAAQFAADAEGAATLALSLYTPAAVQEAREQRDRAVLLSKLLAPADRVDVPPEKPGSSCNWCGRANPPGGLRGDYDPPPRNELAMKPGPHGIPVIDPDPPPAKVVHVDTTPGDLHCADERSCEREREEKLAEYYERNAFYFQSQNWQKLGYHGQAFNGPAWLTAQYEEADSLLQAAEAAAYTARACLDLDEQAGALVALSGAQGAVQPVAGPVPVADNWGHVLGRNREHTLGAMIAADPHVASAPDALAAAKVRRSSPAARRRAAELESYRRRQASKARRFWRSTR